MEKHFGDFLFPMASFITSSLVEINFWKKKLTSFAKFSLVLGFHFLKYEIDFKVVLESKSLSIWTCFSKCGNVFLQPLPPYFFGYSMDVEGFNKDSWFHLKLIILHFCIYFISKNFLCFRSSVVSSCFHLLGDSFVSILVGCGCVPKIVLDTLVKNTHSCEMMSKPMF